MIKLSVLFLFSLSLLSGAQLRAQSGNEKLYRIHVDQNTTIKNIESYGINVFSSKYNEYIDVIASKDKLESFGFKANQIDFLANDFQDLLGSRFKKGSYEDYHNHSETIDLLNDFHEAFPNITKLDTIGYSVLGREICCLKISDNPNEDEDEIPILMVGCHHGNEVLSVEATLYQIDYLLNNYESDTEVRKWIDNMEIWYVPLVNPDGREAITRTNENGVDLNRNYPFQHTAVGNHGPNGFSEPETQAIGDLAARFPPVLSMTYHTSGRLLLLPWTHTDEAAPDSVALTYLGNIIAESIRYPVGNSEGHYELRQGGDWYFTAGEYCDYMYGKHNTYAYTVEMWTRQTPPADVIPEVIERNLEGMKTLFRQAEKAGITGQISDKNTGQAVVAKIEFPEFDNQGKLPPLFSEQNYGRYYKYFQPGTYEMVVSAPGYRTLKESIMISSDSLIVMDIKLDPAPDLSLSKTEINDSQSGSTTGNGDGFINIGETAGLLLTLYNAHTVQASGTYALISTDNPNVELLTDSLYFGSINHFSELRSSDTLLIKLKPNCPDKELINLSVDIGDNISIAWKAEFEFEAHTPNISISNSIIKDSDGNNNGVIDKGETVTLGLELSNTGRQALSGIDLELIIDDPYFENTGSAARIETLEISGKEYVEFEVMLKSDAPEIYSGYATLSLQSSEGYDNQIKLALSNIIGFMDDFENGVNGWTHASYGTTSNHHDDWQLGTPQGKAGDPSQAYSGSNCWGTDLGFDLYLGEYWNGEYQNNVYNYLESPSIDCSSMTGVGIRYQRWLNTRASDLAKIMVNGTQVWKSSIRGHSDQEWTEHLIDISDIADGNPDVKVRFELESGSINALGGWNIDDFLLAHKLGSGTSGIGEISSDIAEAELNCYPNPFSSYVTIEFTINGKDGAEVEILNTIGQKVFSHEPNGYQTGGIHSFIWDGKNSKGQILSEGIYFIKLNSGGNSTVKKVIFMK